MNVWGNWKCSDEAEDRLNKICLKLDSENSFGVSNDWLSLLNYGSLPCDSPIVEEVSALNSKVDEVSDIIIKSLESNTFLQEAVFVGISINSLCRILLSINTQLNEFRFCPFCKYVASWSDDILVEHSLKLVVLPKLKEFNEATGCIIFSIKELALCKPSKFCDNVLIPLLSDDTFQFTDVELLNEVFSVLPAAQKDLVVLTFVKKDEFLENDWLLLHPLIKNLSQNNLLDLLGCIQKFSKNFSKSIVFGRFLLNLCKTLDFIHNKDILKEVLETHQTLLKTPALRYLETI